MRRLIVIFALLGCVVLACAPQQKATRENAGPQNNESLKKIEEFVKAIPPAVAKEADRSQAPEVSQGRPEQTPSLENEPSPNSPPAAFQIVESEIQVPPLKERVKPSAPPQNVQTQGVGLNFEDADIRDVTKVVSEITGKSFIVDNNVKGTVTIYSEKSLLPNQVFELFKSVLEVNGLAITQIGDFYKIVNSDDARKRYLKVDSGVSPTEEDRLITQIVKLKYINARVAKDALKSLTSSGENIVIYPETGEGNTLIITDLASNVKKLLEVIKEMDVSQYVNRYVEVFPVEYADLKDLIKELEQILAIPGATGSLEQMATQPTPQPTPQPTRPGETATPTATPQPASPLVPPGTKTNLYPITRLNALMVSTNNPDVLSLIRKWINILDRPSVAQGELAPDVPINHVYSVRYAKAEELALILAKTYAEGVQSGQPAQSGQQQPQQQQSQQQQQQQQQQELQQQLQQLNQQATGKQVPAPVFIPDRTTNSIIIRATPAQFAHINSLIEKLDQRPLQVLIDVIIADVLLTDSDVFGVKGMLQSEDQVTIGGETNAVGTTAQTEFAGIVGGDGFSYVVTAPGRFLAQLKALATESRVKVLSDPHILVRNNQKAKINIGDNIPIKTIKGTGDQTQESIEYKETGIILTVTPQINFEGDVVMDIIQEVSTVGTKESGATAPPINKTTAETYLVTQDGHPIVIGGLISTRDRNTDNGVPLLKDIPLLGRLFRYKEKQSERKELLILVTPRVVKTPEQGWALTDDVLQKRIKRLEGLFNREESDPEKVERFLKGQFGTQE